MGRRWGASEPGSPLGSGRVKAASLLSPTGQLPHHQRPALHAERPGCHHLAVHPPPAASKTALSSPSPETSPRGALTAPPTPSPGVSQTSSSECLLSFPVSCPLPPAILFTHGGPQGWKGAALPSLLFPSASSTRSLSGARSFPGEWRPAHPPPALPCPLGPGNRLWRSPRPGPDEQGLPQLPGQLFPGLGEGVGDSQKEPKTGTERQSGLCPQQRGQKCGRPTSCPAAQHTAGPGQLSEGSALSSQQGLQTRPQGRPGVHPPLLSADRGSGAAWCPSPRGARPPPAHSEAPGWWQFPPQDSCPLLHAACQVLGGHSQQLYGSCVLSGTLTQMVAGPVPPA